MHLIISISMIIMIIMIMITMFTSKCLDISFALHHFRHVARHCDVASILEKKSLNIFLGVKYYPTTLILVEQMTLILVEQFHLDHSRAVGEEIRQVL